MPCFDLFCNEVKLRWKVIWLLAADLNACFWAPGLLIIVIMVKSLEFDSTNSNCTRLSWTI